MDNILEIRNLTKCYSLVYNKREAEKHPDWRMRNVNGLEPRARGSRFDLCCPNNLQYRAFTMEQIHEFCEYFDFEGVFFDMAFWPMICYCDSCKSRWQREVGGELPTLVDWSDDRWKLFAQKRFEWMGEFSKLMTDTVHKYKADVSVEHQYSSSLKYWRNGLDINNALASDFIGTDLYGGFEQQSFACKAWYNLTMNQPFQYMTSRCYPNLEEHTTMRTMDQLKLCTMMTYFHHGASLLIDGIDPKGTINHKAYQMMGEVFREAENYEPFITRGDMVYDVGLYFDLHGKMNVSKVCDVDSPKCADMDDVPHYQATIGAANALRKHNVPYGIINNYRLDLLDKLKVLVIADDPAMTDNEIQAVLSFVKKGGKLYFSGHTGWSMLQKFFGVTATSYTRESICYLAPNRDCALFLDEFDYDYPMSVKDCAVLIDGEPRGEVLATLVLPYTVPTVKILNPLDYYGDPLPTDECAYRYASVHSNPPGKYTKLPAMLRTTYGAGQVIWSALPFEKANRPQPERVFASMIQQLCGAELLSFGGESADSIECLLFEDEKAREKILGIINLQEDFHTMPAVNTRIFVRCDTPPVKVYHVPDLKEMDYDYQDGRVYISIPLIHHYDMFVIRY